MCVCVCVCVCVVGVCFERLIILSFQVCLKYLMQRSIAVIPKSVTPARIRTNFELFDFTLSDDDMNTINNLEYNERTFNMPL